MTYKLFNYPKTAINKTANINSHQQSKIMILIFKKTCIMLKWSH